MRPRTNAILAYLSGILSVALVAMLTCCHETPPPPYQDRTPIVVKELRGDIAAAESVHRGIDSAKALGADAQAGVQSAIGIATTIPDALPVLPPLHHADTQLTQQATVLDTQLDTMTTLVGSLGKAYTDLRAQEAANAGLVKQYESEKAKADREAAEIVKIRQDRTTQRILDLCAAGLIGLGILMAASGAIPQVFSPTRIAIGVAMVGTGAVTGFVARYLVAIEWAGAIGVGLGVIGFLVWYGVHHHLLALNIASHVAVGTPLSLSAAKIVAGSTPPQSGAPAPSGGAPLPPNHWYRSVQTWASKMPLEREPAPSSSPPPPPTGGHS